MIISFVVLHYESLDDTIKCIDSLKKYLIDNSVNIIVVDNGSKKGKLNIIKEKYNEDRIYFIFSDKNLGFAKGNNLGFVFAKNILHSNVIILCNNDLLFIQSEFITKLKLKIEKLNFDIAGPKIISLVDNQNQNPVPYLYPTLKSVKKRKIKLQILYYLSFFELDIFIKKFFSKNIEEMKNWEKSEYQLHGACLIFGPCYIKQFDGLYNETFMYMEEGILKYLSKKYCLNMLYISDLEVYHKEGSTTGKIYGEGKNKRQFFYKWNIDGCNKLINLMLMQEKKEKGDQL